MLVAATVLQLLLLLLLLQALKQEQAINLPANLHGPSLPPSFPPAPPPRDPNVDTNIPESAQGPVRRLSGTDYCPSCKQHQSSSITFILIALQYRIYLSVYIFTIYLPILYRLAYAVNCKLYTVYSVHNKQLITETRGMVNNHQKGLIY